MTSRGYNVSYSDDAAEDVIKARKRLKLSPDAVLTEQDVRRAAKDVTEQLEEEILKLDRTDRPRCSDRAAKLRGRLQKISQARKIVLRWLTELKQDSLRKPVRPQNDLPEVTFSGLTNTEADYVRRFYQQGVIRLRDGAGFYADFCRGEFRGVDESLIEQLKLADLDERPRGARLAQIGWPFPESADSDREFPGARSVIEFLRAVVGEPDADIPPLRRLLIEACCLYADDTKCQCSSAVNMLHLQQYVEQYSDDRFEDWDKLQIVLCWFLGIANDIDCNQGVARTVMLLRLEEIITEIKQKLQALPQEITCSAPHDRDRDRSELIRRGLSQEITGVLDSGKTEIEFSLKPRDLLCELLGGCTIADAVADAGLPAESIRYIKRQYDVLQDTPRVTHGCIGRQNSPKSGGKKKFSVLERNLIRHRIASWLRRDCRPLSWKDADTEKKTAKSNIVGTKRPGFLPLGDYISLALGLPTTGCYVVKYRESHHSSNAPKLSQKYSAARHVDELISGLLGGATEPVLRRGAIACCPACGSPLLNLRCITKTRTQTSPPTPDTPCEKFGDKVTEFILDDRLLMIDRFSFQELCCIPVDGAELYKFPDVNSRRENLTTVYVALASDSLLSSGVVMDNVELFEQHCQLRLLDQFPSLMQQLENDFIGKPESGYTAARAFRHKFGIADPVSGDPRQPPPKRCSGWIRADAGDFSAWPPQVIPPGKFREQLRSSFWAALRAVLKTQPLAAAMVALIPNVHDRVLALRWLELYPKKPQWTTRYERVSEPPKLLQDLGHQQSSEAAAMDEVVQTTSLMLLHYVIPCLRQPWLGYQKFSGENRLPLPWKDFHEIGSWWQSLKDSERSKRLAAVRQVVTAPDQFAAVLQSWSPPDPDHSLSDEQQNVWDEIGRGLWFLTFHELREHLWKQLQELPSTANHNTQSHLSTATKEVLP